MPGTKDKGYTSDDLDEVLDNPEWTPADFARAKPLVEVLPDLAADHRRRGRQRAPVKKLVSLRLDQDVIERFRADGPGWQARINAALRKAAKL